MKHGTKLKITAILYAVFLLAGCKAEESSVSLPPPLDWIHLTMPKEKILARLPSSQGVMNNSEFLVSLVDINEPEYIKFGINGIYLYFKKLDNELLLKAAHLIYITSPEKKQEFTDYLKNAGFHQTSRQQWTKPDSIVADIDINTRGLIKFTIELKQ